MSNALVKTEPTAVAKKDPVELLRQRFEKLQNKDLDIVHTMDRFAELPSFVEETARKELIEMLNNGTDEEINAKYGFKNKRHLRVALYGTLPKKDWPASMQAAHERVLARTRKQSTDKRANVLNVNIVNIPAPRPPGPDAKIVEIIDEPRK